MKATLPFSRSRTIGLALSALPALFVLFDAAMKIAVAQPVVESSQHLGLPVSANAGIGLLELACLLVYLVPRTAVGGAVLLTGYLGGAVAMHVRVGDSLASHILFPVYVGSLLWAGLLLRDARARSLLAGVDRRTARLS